MNKQYEYLDPAGTDEMRKVLLTFSDKAVANMITNIVDQTSGNKAPSASVIKSLVDNIQKALNQVNVMVVEARKSVDETRVYVDEQIVDMKTDLDSIQQDIDEEFAGVIPIDLYIVDCKYNEIQDPKNYSIYIYKDRNKYGLAYYENDEWYVSGMLIPGLETVITKDDIKIIPDDFIAKEVYIAYYTIHET